LPAVRKELKRHPKELGLADLASDLANIVREVKVIGELPLSIYPILNALDRSFLNQTLSAKSLADFMATAALPRGQGFRLTATRECDGAGFVLTLAHVPSADEQSRSFRMSVSVDGVILDATGHHTHVYYNWPESWEPFRATLVAALSANPDRVVEISATMRRGKAPNHDEEFNPQSSPK
jgi:hypothetical protein